MLLDKRSTPMAALAVLAGAVLWLAAAPASGAEKATLPDGPGKATTEKVCGSCHGVNILMAKRESRDGWNGIVEDMIQRGTKATDDEFGEVVDYLSEHFSKNAPPPHVNVNKANRKDLVTILAITPAQAGAIIQYREANGDFKTVDDVKKVPGLADVIEAKKNRLDF